MCAASVGTATPFATFAVHWWAVSLHQSPPVQSASTLQPPAGSQSPFALHAPDRHTTAPLAAVQGPSPLAYPHFPSGSQAPDRQTLPPSAAVQGPSSFA